MFAFNFYVLYVALIGAQMVFAEDPQQEDRRRPRFPWPSSVSIGWNRAEVSTGVEEAGPSDRALISAIPFFVSCNHTVQGSMSCSNCNQVLYCGPNNVGLQRNCGTRYCNEGRCSVTPTEACGSASSNSTSSS